MEEKRHEVLEREKKELAEFWLSCDIKRLGFFLLLWQLAW